MKTGKRSCLSTKARTDILYIDCTKFEANANKMTFVWVRSTKKYRQKRWVKIMERIKDFDKVVVPARMRKPATQAV